MVCVNFLILESNFSYVFHFYHWLLSFMPMKFFYFFSVENLGRWLHKTKVGILQGQKLWQCARAFTCFIVTLHFVFSWIVLVKPLFVYMIFFNQSLYISYYQHYRGCDTICATYWGESKCIFSPDSLHFIFKVCLFSCITRFEKWA